MSGPESNDNKKYFPFPKHQDWRLTIRYDPCHKQGAQSFAFLIDPQPPSSSTLKIEGLDAYLLQEQFEEYSWDIHKC